jgi:hypothetical protein
MIVMPWSSAAHDSMIPCYTPLQGTQSPSCLISIILSMRFIFSLGLIISGRTRFLNINEHTNEICYTLTWSKNKTKFELIETNSDRVVDTSSQLLYIIKLMSVR